MEIYLEARALTDEHSTKIGAKSNWEAQIERLARAREQRRAKRIEFFLRSTFRSPTNLSGATPAHFPGRAQDRSICGTRTGESGSSMTILSPPSTPSKAIDEANAADRNVLRKASLPRSSGDGASETYR